MFLPYERLAQLVTISALNKENQAMTVFLSQLKVSERKICIRFSDYVKSQVHLNVSGSLYNRHISLYVKVLSFLYGNEKYRDDAGEVLRLFYSDMAGFLINNPSRIEMVLVVDADLGEEVDVYLDRAVESFVSILEQADSSALPELLKNYEFSEILDHVDDLEDAKKKAANYVLAAILLKYAKEKNLVCVRMKE